VYTIIHYNEKSFPSHKAHRAALTSVSLALSQTSVYTARPCIPGQCIARCAHSRPAAASEFVCVLCHEICSIIYLKMHQNAFVGHVLPELLEKITALPGSLAGLSRETGMGGERIGREGEGKENKYKNKALLENPA